jgi:L-seryl-tRNA(Ser) seleniumtransferase
VVALAVDDPERLSRALRAGSPPVVARVNEGRVLLDPRTLAEDELDLVAASVRRAL